MSFDLFVRLVRTATTKFRLELPPPPLLTTSSHTASISHHVQCIPGAVPHAYTQHPTQHNTKTLSITLILHSTVLTCRFNTLQGHLPNSTSSNSLISSSSPRGNSASLLLFLPCPPPPLRLPPIFRLLCSFRRARSRSCCTLTLLNPSISSGYVYSSSLSSSSTSSSP